MSDFLSGLYGYSIVTLAGAAALLGAWEESRPAFDVKDLSEQHQVAAASRTDAYSINMQELMVTDVSMPVITDTTDPTQQRNLREVLPIVPVSAETLAPAQTGIPKSRVTGTTVNLRSGPSTGFEVVGRVKEDDLLELTGNTDGAWVEIKDPVVGNSAWMHGKFLEATGDALLTAQN